MARNVSNNRKLADLFSAARQARYGAYHQNANFTHEIADVKVRELSDALVAAGYSVVASDYRGIPCEWSQNTKVKKDLDHVEIVSGDVFSSSAINHNGPYGPGKAFDPRERIRKEDANDRS